MADNATLFGIHMPPFEIAVKKGIASIMASYSSLNGVKMHANRAMITDYLKNTLKFQGFVISDWLGIDKITTPPRANYTYSIEASINAGIDMVGSLLSFFFSFSRINKQVLDMLQMFRLKNKGFLTCRLWFHGSTKSSWKN